MNLDSRQMRMTCPHSRRGQCTSARCLVLVSVIAVSLCLPNTSAHGQAVDKNAKPFSLRKGLDGGLDFSVGFGNISYIDSLEDYHRGGEHAYKVSGMQIVLHELFGPVGLHQCIDFSWETFRGEFDIPLGYISQFSRSITLTGGVGSRFGNFLRFEPLLGYGWVYHKTAGYNEGEQEDETVFLRSTFEGLVLGSECWLRLGADVGFRVLYTHGLYDKPDDRLTVQWGWLDIDHEFQVGNKGRGFGGVGVRYARLPHGVEEVYIMACIGVGE